MPLDGLSRAHTAACAAWGGRGDGVTWCSDGTHSSAVTENCAAADARGHTTAPLLDLTTDLTQVAMARGALVTLLCVLRITDAVPPLILRTPGSSSSSSLLLLPLL